MTTSEQLDQIAAALAKAQGAMRNAVLNKVNPHFKSKYADLAGIRDAVVPVLASNGIAVAQTLGWNEVGPIVFTRLIHVSGQWIESACVLPSAGDMQKMGSAITYARRYSLSAICGIAADEDDDANAAVQEPKAKKSAPTVPEGFDAWLSVLEGIAQNGTAELQSEWKKSKPELRKYLTDTNPAGWEALKALAARVELPQ